MDRVEIQQEPSARKKCDEYHDGQAHDAAKSSEDTHCHLVYSEG